MSIHYTSDGEARPNFDPERDDVDAGERDLGENDFLSKYKSEADWGELNGGLCQKTVARYRNQPDGLPYLEHGGRIWIPVEDGAEWIRSRVKQRNPSAPNRRKRKPRRAKIEANT